MRKFILAAAAIFGLAGSAQAHVSAVQFPEIGSLKDAAQQAAFGIFQTYAVPVIPQITCNLVTGVASVGGPCTPTAACNGDSQVVTRTVSITSGTKILTTSTSTFAPGDVGKLIRVHGMDSAASGSVNFINAYTSATQVTLLNNSNTTLSAVSKTISYGTSDSAAFTAFNTWAVANQGSNQVVLTVPNGSVCWFGGGPSTTSSWASGIRNLLVEGAGATLTSVGGNTFSLGGTGISGGGIADPGGKSARIKSVSAGATQIELTAASYAAGYATRFSAAVEGIGGWVMLSGIDVQGFWNSPFGEPPNNYWFEWRQITSICINTGPCTGTATLTLDRPLTNAYLDTWPNYNGGSQSAGAADPGGPATVYMLADSWGTTVEYRGLTINQEGQTYARGRSATFRNVTIPGAGNPIPTQNETWAVYNSDFGFSDIETDKLVGTMIFSGSNIFKITFQSTATDTFIANGSTITSLAGGAKNNYITDSTLTTYGTGIAAYGNNVVTNETICTRCAIGTFDWRSANGYIDNDVPAFYYKTGGVIAMPNVGADGSKQRWMVPGAREFFSASGYVSVGMFTLTGPLTQDPWPSVVDNQTVSTDVTMDCSAAPRTLSVSTSIFASGDVGKVIYVNGVGGGGGQLQSWITAYSSPTSVTLGYGCSTSRTASTQTVQWGTSNTYIGTGQSGGFPDLSALSANPIIMRSMGVAKFTCDACTGDPNIVGATPQAGATPAAPVATYTTRTFTASAGNVNLAPSGLSGYGGMPGIGKFVSLTIDVTTPFLGTGNSFLSPTGQFNTTAPTVDQSTWTLFRFFPEINLKTRGKRIIVPGGVTCDTGGGPVAGGCSGDNIAAPSGSPVTGGYPPNAVWLGNGITPYSQGNFSGMTQAPIFTITIQTDQSP